MELLRQRFLQLADQRPEIADAVRRILEEALPPEPTTAPGGIEETIDRLVANNYLEAAQAKAYLFGGPLTPFTRFLDAYSLAFPRSYPATFWREFARALRHSLADTPCYELILPSPYSNDTRDRIIGLINDLLE